MRILVEFESWAALAHAVGVLEDPEEVKPEEVKAAVNDNWDARIISEVKRLA